MEKLDQHGVRTWLRTLLSALAMLGLTVHPALAKDEIVFSTAPTQSPAVTVKLFQPLVDYLSKASGAKIVLKPAKTFLEYTNDMRAGKYDMLFDGPQFVGWRMRRLNHTVLAKLPGSIIFVVIMRDDENVSKVADLAGKKVCSFASPNLLTLGFLDLFPNPARLPIMVKATSFMDTLKCVKAKRGVAAIMRDKFWDKRTAEQKKGLHLMYTSKTPFPHRAVSITTDVEAKIREKLRAALLTDQAAKIAQPILSRFRVKRFVPATDAEYKNMGRLLKPVWGFN